MKSLLKIVLLAVALTLSAPPPVYAETLHEAAQRIARQHDARILSAHTIERDGRRIHVIRILTRDGVVRTIQVPAGRGG